MGVPLFAYYIKNKVKNAFIITSLNRRNNIQIDYLYIDGNAIVHPAAAKITATGIYNKQNNEKNWNPPNYQKYVERKPLSENAKYEEIEICIFQEVCHVIIAAMRITKPKKGVYIVFDGPPPLAKQQQQRERRWKKSIENNISANLLEKKWDSCAISPGTIFMDRLFKYLRYWIRQQNIKIFQGLEIIIDGSNVPGEGEHKIMNYIRKMDEINSHIIYGLDADIFMLTLGLQKRKVYLLREDINKEGKGTDPFYSNGPPEDAIWYFVNVLKIHKWWKKEINIYTKNLDPINNFIFLTFFVGNDFIPPLPICQNLTAGLNLIISTYKEQNRNFLLQINYESNTVCIKYLLLFLKELSKKEKYKCYENALFEKKREERIIEDPEKNKSKALIDNDLIKCYIPNENFKLLNNSKINKEEMVFIYDATKNYKKIWYERAKINTKKELKKMCYDYIYTLIWIYFYYKGNLLDWRYYYKYGYAPFISDIVKYVKEENIKLDTIFSKGNSLTPIQQLMCIVPKTSLNLLPKEFQTPLKEIKGHYMKKEDVFIDMKGKNATYQAIIHLPFLQLEKIIKIYDQNRKKEYKRDKIGKPKKFIWNPQNKERYKCVWGIVENCYFTEINI